MKPSGLFRKNYRIEIEALKPYPDIYQFVTATEHFTGMITEKDLKTIYTLDIESYYNKESLPTHSLVEICVSLDLRKHLEYLHQQYDLRPSILRRNCRVGRMCIVNGDFELYQYIESLNLVSTDELVKPYNYRVLRLAVRHQQPIFYHYFLDNAGSHREAMLKAHRFQTLDIAIEKNDPLFINLLLAEPVVLTHALSQCTYTPYLRAFLAAFKKRLTDIQQENFSDSDKAVALLLVHQLLKPDQQLVDPAHFPEYLSFLLSLPGVKDEAMK